MNRLRYGAKIFAIVLAMNGGMNYWVNFSSFFSAFKNEIHKEN